MSLADALNVIWLVVGGIVDVLMSVLLFGVPLGAFFVVAFIISRVLSTVFDIESDDVSSFSQWNQSKKSKGKGGK